jgi:hypothetical protein
MREASFNLLATDALWNATTRSAASRTTSRRVTGASPNASSKTRSEPSTKVESAVTPQGDASLDDHPPTHPVLVSRIVAISTSLAQASQAVTDSALEVGIAGKRLHERSRHTLERGSCTHPRQRAPRHRRQRLRPRRRPPATRARGSDHGLHEAPTPAPCCPVNPEVGPGALSAASDPILVGRFCPQALAIVAIQQVFAGL